MMKKVLCIAAVLAMVVGVQAEAEAKSGDVGPFGIGYQGVTYSEGYIMNQIALRFAPKPIGGAIVIGQMTGTDEGTINGVVIEDSEFTLLSVQGKFYWTLIDRPNSDFYLGGLLGLGFYSYEDSFTNEEVDSSSFMLGFLAGVEWRFTELPELGINFEVGYNLEFYDDEETSPGTTLEYDGIMAGTSVSLGATYYF